MLRALIHATVGPIVANLLMWLITFLTTLVFGGRPLDVLMSQTLEMGSNLMTLGGFAVFLIWALLALVGMVIAGARRPWTVLGVVRLVLGALLVGGPGVTALVVYGPAPIVGVPVWALFGGGALAACRLVCRLVGAEPAWREQVAATPAPVAAFPDSRAVFGRRGVS